MYAISLVNTNILVRDEVSTCHIDGKINSMAIITRRPTFVLAYDRRHGRAKDQFVTFV